MEAFQIIHFIKKLKHQDLFFTSHFFTIFFSFSKFLNLMKETLLMTCSAQHSHFQSYSFFIYSIYFVRITLNKRRNTKDKLQKISHFHSVIIIKYIVKAQEDGLMPLTILFPWLFPFITFSFHLSGFLMITFIITFLFFSLNIHFLMF